MVRPLQKPSADPISGLWLADFQLLKWLLRERQRTAACLLFPVAVSRRRLHQFSSTDQNCVHLTGATSQKYEANVDDIGFILAAKYTPVREDGLVGEPVTAQTTPIAIGKSIRHLYAVSRFWTQNCSDASVDKAGK